MRNAAIQTLIATIALAVPVVTASDAAEARHRFLAIDNNRNRLLYVDQHEPARGWVVSIPAGSRDLQVLDHARVLVSHGNGAAEYALENGQRLDWVVDGYSQINTAQRLSNGHTLLGANTAAGIVIHELDGGRNPIGKLALPGLKDMRLMRRLENGHTLLTVAGPCRVVEVDRQGKTVWQAPLPGKGYKAVRLANGNTLVSTGGPVTVIEVNPAGDTVRTAGGKQAHPGLGLDWSSGFDVLPNGNIVIANWLGHGKMGTGPHLVEFDRDNKLVWKWEDHQQAATVTNVLILDR